MVKSIATCKVVVCYKCLLNDAVSCCVDVALVTDE